MLTHGLIVAVSDRLFHISSFILTVASSYLLLRNPVKRVLREVRTRPSTISDFLRSKYRGLS